MKTNWVQMAGSMLLLACMVFALLKLDSADQWARVWLPFVGAGVLLVFFGTIAGRPADEPRRRLRTAR